MNYLSISNMVFLESDIRKMVTECVSLLLERNMGTLYHFVCIDSLLHILKNNRFDLNDCGDGTYYMSATRNRNSQQGYPYMQSDYSQGGGSYHNAGFAGIICRLELDGEKLRAYGKVGPFDYIYDEGDVRDDDGNYLNGKQDAMTYFGDNEEMYHQPFSQGEERLTSKIKSIPHADRIINRIDVYIDPYQASDPEWQKYNGKDLEKLIKEYGDRINFYDDRSKFDHQSALNENKIDERGGSEILYHFTSINSIKSMLQNNGKNGGYFSLSHPGKVDKQILGREGDYTHYLSLTRSPNANWGYTKAIDPNASYGKGGKQINVSPTLPNSVGSARITFDGRALSAGRVIKPIDFFGPYTDENGKVHKHNLQTTSGKWANGDATKMSMIKQAEDRLFGYTYDFDGILNYITRIDILASSKDSIVDAKEVLDLAKGTPVEGKIHVYGDFKSYNRPDFERIKSAGEKVGISPLTWRPEITDKLDTMQAKKKRMPKLIESAKLKNLAVFVWIVLFMEKYGNLAPVNESNMHTGLFRFNSLFSAENVLSVIKELTGPIREPDLNKKITNMIFSTYESLTNSEIAKYCFSGNPKFDFLKGISKSMIHSIFKIIEERFNLDNYTKLFVAAAKIMKMIWPHNEDIKTADKDKKARNHAAYERMKDRRRGIVTQYQRGNAAASKLKKLDKVNGEPKKRGRKPSDIVIPSLTFRINGKPVTITDVTDTHDAIKKLSELVPSYDFMSKKTSIAAKVSNTKRALKEPSLFNQEDIEEMVNECVKKLLGQ